jgi:hypothetical protein
MNALALALCLASGDPALPVSVAQEEFRQRPDEGAVPVMEYLYRHSGLEAGVLYTAWDSDLDVEDEPGVYVRWGVGFAGGLSLNLTYRHYDFGSSEILGPEEELLVRGLLAGAAWERELTPEFTVQAGAGAGFMKWETDIDALSDDTGLLLSFEGSASVRLHEALRLKAGLAFDWCRTDFHRDSDEGMLNVSFLVGFELGG